MLNQSYKFGIEIEFANANLTEVERTMREAGSDVVREGYNHTTRRHWKIVTDATVSTGSYSYASGTGNGGELVSPVLCGEDGLRELETALDALNAHPDIAIDRRCGLHVHLSWPNMQADHIKEIVRRYAKFENHIDRWMPRSRRGSSSQWCSSIVDNSVDRVRDMSDLSARRAGMQRSMKVNLDSYSRHGTIEFRHHSGTTDYTKISNWVRFLIAFVEASKNSQTISTGQTDLNVTYKRTKKAAYGELREQLAAKGWSLDFAGGRGPTCKYKLVNAEGEFVRHIFTEEMESFYDQDELEYENRRQLTTEAVDFWLQLFPPQEPVASFDEEAENVYRGVPDDVVNYLEMRIATLPE